MSAPDHNDREWLSLIPSLMREVRPDEYIWSKDPTIEAARQARRARRAGFVSALRLVVVVLATIVVMHVMGYRRVSPTQEHTLAMAERLDPDHEVDDDRLLADRWGTLPQAYRLVRLAVASELSVERYPWLAELSGHPVPAVSPGNGPAVLLLVNMLDLYPSDDQARLLGRLLALAAVMDQPGLISGFEAVAKLPNEVRRHFFAADTTSFARILALEQSIEAAEVQASEIDNELEARRTAILEQRGTLRRDLDQLKLLASRNERVTRECIRHLDKYIACLPDDIPSRP